MTGPRSPSSYRARGAGPGRAEGGSVEAAHASRDRIVTHLRMLSERIGARPAGTEQGLEARKYFEGAIRRVGGIPETQPFGIVIPRYRECTLTTGTGRTIPCLPALGSAATAGVVRAVPNPWETRATGPAAAAAGADFLLCPVGPNPVSAYIRVAAERKAAGVILYHPDVPDLYSEVLPRRDDGLPCVTVRRADAERLARERAPVRLQVAAASVKILCSNILVEIGAVGRPLLVLAHYDTRAASPGALCNASGTAILLELLGRLGDWPGPRIVLGFLDGEELNAAGSRHCRDVLHAMGTLKYLRGVIYVSDVGLQSIGVLSSESDPMSQRSSVAGQSRLVTVARQCVVGEKLDLLEETDEPDARIPAGIWSCPTIGLAGPATSARHTSADLPGLVDPDQLAATAAALDRLTRTVGTGTTAPSWKEPRHGRPRGR
jgi:peptidase M28-like protein